MTSPDLNPQATGRLQAENRRYRNSKLPIYRLPPELLTIVFFRLRDIAEYHERSYEMLTITWVSFYWRETALSNRFLWDFIDLTHEDAVDAFLPRSRGLDLTVNVWADTPDVFVPIFQGLSRIKSLHLTCPDFDNYGVMNLDNDVLLQPHWSQPAPQLRELSLENIHIPPNPFTNICPALRIVELTECAFDWDTLSFSTITDLRLQCPATIVEPASFVEKLQQMPLLEVLILEDVFLEPEGAAQVRHGLPRLKSLNIMRVRALTLLDFLHRISLPPIANVSVVPDDCDGLVPDMISELRACQDGASKSLAKFRLHENSYKLTLETITSPEGGSTEGARSFSSFTPWQSNHIITEELLAYYDFSALIDLKLYSDNHEISKHIWTTTFTHLPHLVSLDLSGVFAYSFIKFITPSTSSLAGYSPGVGIQDLITDELRQNVIFPAITKLALHRVEYLDQDGHEEEMEWPDCFSTFCLALGLRLFVGCRVQELEITRYMLFTEEIEHVEGMVGRFVYMKNPLADLYPESDASLSGDDGQD